VVSVTLFPSPFPAIPSELMRSLGQETGCAGQVTPILGKAQWRPTGTSRAGGRGHVWLRSQGC
jgi:hypothetical protein